MGLFEDLGKTLENIGEEAVKHASHLGQEIAKHAEPAAQGFREHFDNFGRSALPVAENAIRHANSIANDVSKHVAPIAADQKHINYATQDVAAQLEKVDWSFIQNFGEHVGKQIGSTADQVWTAMITGDVLKTISHESNAFIQNAQEHLPGMGDRTVRWFTQHPKQAVELVACIIAAPTIMAVTPAALGLVGFGMGGVTAGSLAAGAQAGMGGVVASSSAFAILQSAGAGGSGLVLVNAIAGSVAMAGTCSAAAVGFLDALKKSD